VILVPIPVERCARIQTAIRLAVGHLPDSPAAESRLEVQGSQETKLAPPYRPIDSVIKRRATERCLASLGLPTRSSSRKSESDLGAGSAYGSQELGTFRDAYQMLVDEPRRFGSAICIPAQALIRFRALSFVEH
jgi:hypothetical protein